MLKHTSATSSMSNKGLFMLGNMGPFMLVEQKILVLQPLFSRKYGAHTRLFVWGRSLVNTLGTTANPYCYGARSWSLSRAPPPAIHGCHQCAAQPKSCIIHCQPCPSRLCCTAVSTCKARQCLRVCMACTVIIVSALPSVIESHGLIGYSLPHRKPQCFVLTFFTAGPCEMVGVPYRLASRVLSIYRSMSQ
jgi:hypothetical protein